MYDDTKIGLALIYIQARRRLLLRDVRPVMPAVLLKQDLIIRVCRMKRQRLSNGASTQRSECVESLERARFADVMFNG